LSMIRRTHPLLMHIHEFFVECLRVPADMEIPGTKLTPCVDCGKPALRCLMFLLCPVVCIPLHFQNHRHLFPGHIEAHEKIRLVAVLDMHVLVGDNAPEIIVARIEAHNPPLCKLLQLEGSTALPGCSISYHLVEMTVLHGKAGASRLEIDLSRSA